MMACAFDSSGSTAGGLDGTEGHATHESSSTVGHATSADDTITTGASHDGSTSGPAETSNTDDGRDDTGSSSDTDEDAPMLWCDREDLDLVACYDFEDIGTGMLFDGSAHGNDGTIEGVTVVASPLGQAVVFDQASRVAVPDSPSLDLTFEMTLEVWLRVDALPTSGRMGVLDNDGQYSIFLYAGDGLRCSGSGHSLFHQPVPTSKWMHVACVVGDDMHRMYVDGELVGETSFHGPMQTGNTNPMAIGDDSPAFDQPLAGAIAGVRIWSRPLARAELCAAASVDCR